MIKLIFVVVVAVPFVAVGEEVGKNKYQSHGTSLVAMPKCPCHDQRDAL